jgi:hypothetical protein
MRDEKPQRGYRFNPDPVWQQWVYEKYRRVIARIAHKYCTSDQDLREDLEQEAMIALMTIDPKEVKAYKEYEAGLLTEKEWQARLDTYLRQVCRNSILAPLQTTATGNWYVGRKRKRKDPITKESAYVFTPAPYLRIEDVLHKMQIDTDGGQRPRPSRVNIDIWEGDNWDGRSTEDIQTGEKPSSE